MNVNEIRNKIKEMPTIVIIDISDYREEIIMMKSKGYTIKSIWKTFTSEFGLNLSLWKMYNYLTKYPITKDELNKAQSVDFKESF